jgi:hypothetical protein
MFIVSPRKGLCNQLQTIVKGILLGIKYKRDVYIDKFQMDYNKNELCDINKVLNIDKMNVFLSETCGTKIKILDSIGSPNFSHFRMSELDSVDISTLYYINNHIERYEDKPIIYLGNIVSVCIKKTFGYQLDDYTNPYYVIMSNLRFNDAFYDIKNFIKNKLELSDNYTTVHLRVEDDAIKHFAHCYNLSIKEYINANI